MIIKMKRLKSTFTLLLALCASMGFAQNDDRPPIEAVKAVADRVIENTPFKFRAILAKPDKYFRGIKTINFERSLGLGEPGVAYAYTVIESERESSIPIEVAHSDGVKIWLNGKVVFEKEKTGAAVVTEEERDTFLEDKFTANMQKGSNTLLVKSETAGEEWKVYLRPRYPAVPEGEKKDDQWMTISASNIPLVTEEVGKLAPWLLIGPFPNEGRKGLGRAYPPEEEFVLGILYEYGDRKLAWELPKVEIYADVIDADPLWGTLYDWNYHTAGLAWAIRQLGEYTNEQRFIDYMSTYCNFMLKIKPYVKHEKYTLNRPYSRHIHLWDTPLLDFTTAPTLPFAYRLLKDKSFENREAYVEMVENTQDYVVNEQVRLEDGTFTRETPFKYTTWVDDMFMGIPFLLHSALLAESEEERNMFFDDAANQVLGFHKRVYDPEADLYMHAQYSERPNAKLPYWSRANGWGIWAVTEVLLHLPKNHKHYKKIMKIYRDHVKSLVKTQNAETGFYHNVLDRKDSFKETSGTAIHTMAIARGINNGWLKRKKYEEYAMKGWQALETVIADNGKVTDICMGTMCSEDVQYYFKRPVVVDDSHGLLGLVFCGIEMQKLVEGK